MGGFGLTGQPDLCPTCHSGDLSDIGALPAFDAYKFAGGASVTLDAGHLIRCDTCRLHFRYPSIPGDDLKALYREGAESAWQYDERRDWAIVSGWLNQYCLNRSILDVGCFRGDFLRWLGDGWKLIGVEPSDKARGHASRHGIELVGYFLEDLEGMEPCFGAITLLDVLEHFPNPLRALRIAYELLTPGGVIVIYTGATDVSAWRLMGADYYYCAYPEHLSFINNQWIDWASRELGLAVLKRRRISHENGGFPERWMAGCRVLAHQVVKMLVRNGVSRSQLSYLPYFGRAATWTSPPWCAHIRDHILVCLRKGI